MILSALTHLGSSGSATCSSCTTGASRHSGCQRCEHANRLAYSSGYSAGNAAETRRASLLPRPHYQRATGRLCGSHDQCIQRGCRRRLPIRNAVGHSAGYSEGLRSATGVAPRSSCVRTWLARERCQTRTACGIRQGPTMSLRHQPACTLRLTGAQTRDDRGEGFGWTWQPEDRRPALTGQKRVPEATCVLAPLRESGPLSGRADLLLRVEDLCCASSRIRSVPWRISEPDCTST